MNGPCGSLSCLQCTLRPSPVTLILATQQLTVNNEPLRTSVTEANSDTLCPPIFSRGHPAFITTCSRWRSLRWIQYTTTFLISA
jgi:hypothetical protein